MPVIHLRLLGGVQLMARENGVERRTTLPPKPLALLAFLALAMADGRPSVRRDLLLALFWPELSDDHARAALRQMLFQLRRVAGASAFSTDRETVALVPESLACDVVEFAQHLARGERASAMELYRGPLLEGFFVDGMSAELEAWMETERARLQRQAFRACQALTGEAEQARNAIAAAHWARQAVALAPDDEIAVRRLIEILDRFGDRAGALRAADDLARRLAQEFGTTPSAETQALVAVVRGRRSAHVVDETPPAPPALPAPPGAPSQPAGADVSGTILPDAGPALARAPASGQRWRAGARRLVAWRSAALGVVLLAMVAGGELAGAHSGRGAVPDSGTRTGNGSPALTIASPVARTLYDEGLDRYYAGDPRESARLLGEAIAEDSNCAMCAYYAVAADAEFDDSAQARMQRLALRLADRVSEPERLLIHFQWADAVNSPARRAVADSLVARYPGWPEAQLAEAGALGMDGEWLAEAEHLRRAIASEPPPDSGAGPRCPACSARFDLVSAYEAADSLPAALRAARAAVRTQPRSRVAWLALSHVLAESGRYGEARAALDSSTSYASGTDGDEIERAQIEIRAGDYTDADRLLRALGQAGIPDSRHNALWFLVISLRDQGRLREALALAEGPLRWSEVAPAPTKGVGIATVAEAQVLFELGEYRRAAGIFAANAWPTDAFSRAAPGRIARQRVWMLTQAGSALAGMGDTVGLARLADTVEIWGGRSGFGRDRRLHGYLRGLLWMARARPESAAVSFRRAEFSETQGFSRLNYELARALLALGRPREAIPVLRHSLGGALEAGNFYVTQTELQELLGRAYDAAGEPDSAQVYYRSVAQAWRTADPQFQPRVAHARERLATDVRLQIARR